MTWTPLTDVRSTAQVDRIRIRVEPYDWSFPREDEARIEAYWAGQLAEKPALFDGRVLLSNGIEVRDGTATGTAFVTGYKAFLSWRGFGYPGPPVHNFFAMPALLSSDGAFMVGRMSAGTANAGRLYFPAGTPEPSDAGPDRFVDCDANILRELGEETGLAPDDVTLDPQWTVIFAGPMIACMKIARASLPADALQDKVAAFIAGERDPELDGLCPIRGVADLDQDRMSPFLIHYLKDRFEAA